jgi:hypothetical protein
LGPEPRSSPLPQAHAPPTATDHRLLEAGFFICLIPLYYAGFSKHWILVSTSSSLETNIVKVIRVRSRLCFSHHSKAPVDTPAANRMIDVLIDRDGVLRFREGRDIFTPQEMATRLANLLESLRHETTA